MTWNMDQAFHETASRQPEYPAVLGPGASEVITYGVLDRLIETAAEKLIGAGVKRGDCIGLHLPGSAGYIIWNYAIWRSGGCVVPIPVELADDEKRGLCRQMALRGVLTHHVSTPFAAPLSPVSTVELDRSAAFLSLPHGRQHPPGFRELDAAFIRFTSGTTGDSKGVVLSHRTIDERIRAANEALRITPSDRVAWVLSMSYHFTVSIVAYLTFGAAIVLPANHFASAVAEAIERYQATLLYASPLHFALLADEPHPRPLNSLRLAISTTSALDGRIAAAFAARRGLPISQALGIIEVGLPCINVDGAATAPASVGRVLPAYELRLEDAGLGPEIREIQLRGPGFLDAYYDPWQPRQQVLRDGWFRTGDVGRLDDAGYLYLCGRTKELINVMGMKFFPQEVEEVLASHPLVGAASVFARPDPRWGEMPQARVVVADGRSPPGLVEELRRYCRQRLASYKVPERIELVASLPRTASGKVLHRAR